jgi:hypothetical protein
MSARNDPYSTGDSGRGRGDISRKGWNTDRGAAKCRCVRHQRKGNVVVAPEAFMYQGLTEVAVPGASWRIVCSTQGL